MPRLLTSSRLLGLMSFVWSLPLAADPAKEPDPPAAPSPSAEAAPETPPESTDTTPATADEPATPAPEDSGYHEQPVPEQTPHQPRAVEPALRRTDEAGAIYEPPLPAPYTYAEPKPPPAPRHVAPRTALWVGLRTGWFFPMGSLWQDGSPVGGLCCTYTNRGFDDFATSGPLLELDLGARLSRHYNVFGLWEFGLLGDGDELGDEFGGQQSAHTHFWGIGLRFSSEPNDAGILVEMAIGHRRFEATWRNGTEFLAIDSFFNTRIGIGADLRINEKFSLSPLLTIGGGIFERAEWTFADGSTAGAFSSFLDTPVDEAAQHVPVTLQIGIHHDAFGSRK